MSENSPIEWTDATWNPITGCTKVSPGCANCYAETFAERFRGVPGHPYQQGFDLKLWSNRLELPLTWRKPKRIFVNSMSDLFHKDVPLEFILEVFHTMNKADWHCFQTLTKRADRLLELDRHLPWTDNIWAGVSVENADYVHRIDYLRETHAKTKFLSVEPLLGAIPDMNLKGIDWVIVGGESGNRCRPVQKDWVLDIRDQCQRAGVHFFFKQWGGRNKKAAGRVLEGRTWDEMPPSIASKNKCAI
ncbi:MAG: phage Gp37/Gp68 family protein [Candidatus Obscuribacterales bacterium]|nr:phage Gp37/Gp68 family protein [Candidatus Obscuribacterales bacterium]